MSKLKVSSMYPLLLPGRVFWYLLSIFTFCTFLSNFFYEEIRHLTSWNNKLPGSSPGSSSLKWIVFRTKKVGLLNSSLVVVWLFQLQYSLKLWDLFWEYLVTFLDHKSLVVVLFPNLSYKFKLQACKSAILLKRDSNTGVFLQILQYFY